MSESEQIDASQFAQLVVPRFSASTFNVSVTATEVVLLCSAMSPGHDGKGTIVMGQAAQVVLSLSPHAAKELSALLANTLRPIEDEIGEIRTPWLVEVGAVKPKP